VKTSYTECQKPIWRDKISVCS